MGDPEGLGLRAGRGSRRVDAGLPRPTPARATPARFRIRSLVAPAPPLTTRQWRVLMLVATASFFDQYDLSLFALALTQIQAALGVSEAQVGNLTALVSFGALPSVLVSIAADRIGRRRALLFTICAYTVLTAATALAADARTFVGLQFLARTFSVAEI